MNRVKVSVNINRAPIDELTEVYGLRKKTAEIFITGRPYMHISDVLRNEALMKEASAEELSHLLITPDKAAGNRPVSVYKQRICSTLDNGIVCGMMELHDGEFRIFLEHPNGSQFVSVGMQKDTQDQLDYSTFQIVGMFPWELIALPSEARNACHRLLHEALALAAGRLWQAEGITFISPELTPSISRLSQMLFMLQQATSPATFNSKGKWKTDGCTNVPDFDIERCCNEHDQCYCKGGSESDRLKCDVRFYECIKNNSALGVVLALIYYWGVRALGASHFNYYIKTEEKEAQPDTTSGDASGLGKVSATCRRCRVKVTLARVDYNGKDIGDDWSYSILVEKKITKIAEHTVPHLTSDHLSRLVYDDIKGNCGGSVTLDISINATEHDSTWDDRGSNTLRLSFQCIEGATYTSSIVVSVYEGWYGTAELKFVFEIETFCVK